MIEKIAPYHVSSAAIPDRCAELARHSMTDLLRSAQYFAAMPELSWPEPSQELRDLVRRLETEADLYEVRMELAEPGLAEYRWGPRGQRTRAQRLRRLADLLRIAA